MSQHEIDRGGIGLNVKDCRKLKENGKGQGSMDGLGTFTLRYKKTQVQVHYHAF